MTHLLKKDVVGVMYVYIEGVNSRMYTCLLNLYYQKTLKQVTLMSVSL